MGVILIVSMNPFRIEADEWKEVYQEAMLISKYEGLAYIKQKVYNQTEVHCLAYSNSERIETSRSFVLQKYIKANPHEKLMHWNCIGDILTGSNMEEFNLYDNIEYYRYSCLNSWISKLDIDMEKTMSTEILFDYINPEKYDTKYSNYDSGTSIVMAGKTQGEYGHMGILEIGCLLADRFPNSVTIRGDVSYAQCVRAVSRVNKILGRTIKLPERYDCTIVFERLSKIVDDRTDLLNLFYEIYAGPREQVFRDFINLNFTEKEIGSFYIKQYGADNKVALIKEWFIQDRSLEKLCEVIVDTYSAQETYSKEIREFINALIRCKIHVECKEVGDPTEFNSVYRSTPDTVGEQFSKIFGQMIGLQNNYVNKYIPIEELMEICIQFFGEQSNVKILFEEAIDTVESDVNLQHKDKIYDTITSLGADREKEEKEKEKYEHMNYHTLYAWEHGDTVHPDLEDNLLLIVEKIKGFGERVIKEYTKKSRYGDNVGELTALSNFTDFIGDSITRTKLFKETDLDYLLSKEFPRESTLGSVIIGMCTLKVDYTIEPLVRGLFLNYKLLEFYVNKWEKSKQ